MKFKVGDKVKIGDEMCTIVNTFIWFNCNNYNLISESGIEFTRKEIEISKYKPTIEDLRDYMLEHFVDSIGNLDICGLDFSNFEGNVYITEMKCGGDLSQSGHKVNGFLWQNGHKVNGDLQQCDHEVGGDIFQNYINVKHNYNCHNIKYGGNIYIDEPQKILKEITKEELSEMGYKLKG